MSLLKARIQQAIEAYKDNEKAQEEIAQAYQAYDEIINEHQFGEDDDEDELVFDAVFNMMDKLNSEYNGFKGQDMTLRQRLRRIFVTDASIKRAIQYGRVYIGSGKAQIRHLDDGVPDNVKVYVFDEKGGDKVYVQIY